MIVSAHQPAYLPWRGYFDKIIKSDVFVFLDTVQFEKNSFINRNIIKASSGPLWLTIPVLTKGHISGSLRTTQIDETRQWRTRHLKSIEMNYRKTPRFEERFPKLDALIRCPESNLADYCFHHLLFWLKELSISVNIVRSSELMIDSHKSDLILDICRHFGAEKYVSGALGRDYLAEECFANEGVSIEYQAFEESPYTQLWGGFLPNLSIIDWWMNENNL